MFKLKLLKRFVQWNFSEMLEWTYDGVNSSIPRNSGPECANYMSPKRRIIETFCVSIFIIFCLSWGYKRIKLPKPMPYVNQDRVGKRVLLIVMSLVLGMEIGFKLTSRTFIYFMNPCHVHTIAQVSVLIMLLCYTNSNNCFQRGFQMLIPTKY